MRLVVEQGIAFDDEGRANEGQRVAWDELRRRGPVRAGRVVRCGLPWSHPWSEVQSSDARGATLSELTFNNVAGSRPGNPGEGLS